MYYLILGNPKVFTYDTLEKLQAALNAKVKVGEETGIKLLEGEELSVEAVYEQETIVQNVPKLKIRGRKYE